MPKVVTAQTRTTRQHQKGNKLEPVNGEGNKLYLELTFHPFLIDYAKSK